MAVEVSEFTSPSEDTLRKLYWHLVLAPLVSRTVRNRFLLFISYLVCTEALTDQDRLVLNATRGYFW